MRLQKSILIAGLVVGLLIVALLLRSPREDRIHMLYVTNGQAFDGSAYGNFQQTLIANVSMDRLSFDDVSARKLRAYDAVYLDVGLAGTDRLKQNKNMLEAFVRKGGHLFLENAFVNDFPLSLIGASQTVPLSSPATKIELTYPSIDFNLQEMQKLVRLFTETFNTHVNFTTMPELKMGQGFLPSTAVSLADWNGVSLMSANRYGKGSVIACSGFLPNRYFITGFDMQSGMDTTAGFDAYITQYANNHKPRIGSLLFNFKDGLPMQPYFNFDFATINYQLRSSFLAYVSKQKLGYSLEKVLGPYGRPALAFQNHFETLSAIRDKEGIQWSELLKKYNMIPSFSLIRSSYDWQVWKEGIITHLNVGTADKPEFVGEYANSFYSSGAFLEAGGKRLTLSQYPSAEAQLADDKIKLPYRAFPTFADLNRDGKQDLVVGGADGRLVVYLAQKQSNQAYATQPLPAGVKTPDAFEAAQYVVLPSGKQLTLAKGYATPVVFDTNGDGISDLIIGDGNGSVWLSRGSGNLTFAEPVPLLSQGGTAIRVTSYATPTIGDLNGDGVLDLVVGDGDGHITLFAGTGRTSTGMFGNGNIITRTGLSFAAPSIRDMNGDNRADLIIGNIEGDLQVYRQGATGNWVVQGAIQGRTANQMGTKALVGGHNSVPLWYDINGDGLDDLIVGQLQFGDAIPIDDPNFPYTTQLKEFIEYAAREKLQILPHVFVHNFMSVEQEKQELALQKQAFTKLGLPWTNTGTNQHTWRINNPDRLQTLRNESEADIWFNFGFRAPNSPNDPHEGFEYAWLLPFLLQDDQLKSPMLLYSPVLRFNKDGSSKDIYEGMAQLDMPISYFEHIEYSFPATAVDTSPTRRSDKQRTDKLNNALIPFVQYFDTFRTQQNYNFMQETQMARSFLTTLQADVTVSQSWGTYLWNRVKDVLGEGVHLTLTLKPDVSNVPDLAGYYKQTLGVVIKPGKKLAQQPLAVDSDVFSKKYDALYTGLSRDTTLTVSWNSEPFHVIRSNVPFDIDKLADGEIRFVFKEDGMQQLKLYSPYALEIVGSDLKVETNEREKTYTITHFGAATTVTVMPRK